MSKLDALDKLRLYRLSELEDTLGYTHQTLLRYVKTGKLKAVRIGNCWKVPYQAIVNFVNTEGEEKNEHK